MKKPALRTSLIILSCILLVAVIGGIIYYSIPEEPQLMPQEMIESVTVSELENGTLLIGIQTSNQIIITGGGSNVAPAEAGLESNEITLYSKRRKLFMPNPDSDNMTYLIVDGNSVDVVAIYASTGKPLILWAADTNANPITQELDVKSELLETSLVWVGLIDTYPF